ncbi:hypothetical protein AGMMS4952_23680 [Spirochaetia bacterium]|nr:hypothetical protein AGMMS4952_23680 [Spirochaetia bacterium]
MDLTKSQPICLRCKNVLQGRNSINTSSEIGTFLRHLPDTIKLIIQIGWGVGTALLFVASIYVHTKYNLPFLYIPVVVSLLGGLFSFIFLKESFHKSSKHPPISNAQLETVLRLNGGSITARQLASATSTAENTAEEYLKQQALDGKITPVTDSGTFEMTYKKGF